ncbi:hypothetical protein EJD97_002760, partial [Solanum chilense]
IQLEQFKGGKERKKSYLLVANALVWAAESGGRVEQEVFKPIGEDGDDGGSNDRRMGAYGQRGIEEKVCRVTF